MDQERLGRDGYLITTPLLDADAMDDIDAALRALRLELAGTRSLLMQHWCAALAQQLKGHPLVHRLLPEDCVAVQCTYFDKSPGRNWLVPMHQDLSIPVRKRIEHEELSGWSEKEGILYVQAPASVLENMVALRLHLDDCGNDNGPLKVIPGSHRFGRISDADIAGLRHARDEVVCVAVRGAALAMHPLLLHASSKSASAKPRRVLHFLYASPQLPFGLDWHHSL